MKRSALVSGVLVSTAILLLTLNAQTGIPENLVGRWALNTANWQVNSGIPRPKQAILIISKASVSRFKWEVTTTFSDGNRSVMGADGPLDGKPYEYKGAERGTQIAFIENNGALEGTATYVGGGTVHQILTLSPDGNTITAQCRLDFPASKKSWTEIWERVPDKKRK